MEAKMLDDSENLTYRLLPLTKSRETLTRLRTEFSYVDFIEEMVGLDEDNEGSTILTFKERQVIREAFLQGLDLYRSQGIKSGGDRNGL
jgi:hypothetical protein